MHYPNKSAKIALFFVNNERAHCSMNGDDEKF